MIGPCFLFTFSFLMLAIDGTSSRPAPAHSCLPVARFVHGEGAAGAQESAKKSDAATLSLQERVWIASKFYASIQVYFAHWEGVPKLELDKRYKEYLEKAIQSDSRLAFDLASMEFVAHLRNGHSRFQDQWLRDTHGQQLGFLLQPIDKRWVVINSRLPDLTPGDVVEAIDGKPVNDFLEERSKYVSVSSDAVKYRTVLYSPYLFPDSFTLKLEDGRAVQIRRKEQTLKSAPASMVEKRELDDGLGYVQIRSFLKPEFETKAIEFVKEFSTAKCLIIDVRGNGGGTTPGRLIRSLMTDSYPHWSVGSAVGYLNRGKSAITNASSKPGTPLFKNPIVILIDGHTGSAAEDFVMPFKVTGRALLVGETTYGSSGQPFFFNAGNGITLSVSMRRLYFPGGGQFEGVGVAPDVAIEPTRDDIRKGIDVVLNRAIVEGKKLASK